MRINVDQHRLERHFQQLVELHIDTYLALAANALEGEVRVGLVVIGSTAHRELNAQTTATGMGGEVGSVGHLVTEVVSPVQHSEETVEQY